MRNTMRKQAIVLSGVTCVVLVSELSILIYTLKIKIRFVIS